MRILVTGGTGSFGKAFIRDALSRYRDSEIVVFSRDELKQWEMQNSFSKSDLERLRFFLGDIRDKERLTTAFHGCDTVIHAAALKHVPAAEYNPMEFIKTNVFGSENVVQASLEAGVKKVVALSTDKAAAPVNLYGATKLCADKLFVAANNITGKKSTRFSVVRYGNVMGSRGSVIPFFLSKAKEGKLPITSTSMTRFNITLKEGVKLVNQGLAEAQGGEIFVPKIPSYRVSDLAKAIAPSATVEVVGIRPGEKLHEEMITSSDSLNTVDMGSYYVIRKDSCSEFVENMVPPGFSYSSDKNRFLTIEEIRELIRENIKSDFTPT